MNQSPTSFRHSNLAERRIQDYGVAALPAAERLLGQNTQIQSALPDEVVEFDGSDPFRIGNDLLAANRPYLDGKVAEEPFGR
jgi:hypothetical protein